MISLPITADKKQTTTNNSNVLAPPLATLNPDTMSVGHCCLFTFYAIFSYSFCVTTISVVNWMNIDGIVALPLYMLCLVAHIRAAFTDPGWNHSGDDASHTMESSQKDAIILRCPKCCRLKPLRTHHCKLMHNSPDVFNQVIFGKIKFRVCKRCILKMDHHCPWINNCVGLYNQKYFFLFIFYLTILCGYLSAFIIYKFIYQVSSENDRSILSTLINYHIDVFFLMIVTLGSLIFGLVMFFRQAWSIHNNITTVEYKKGDIFPALHDSKWSNYEEVFGSGPCYLWLSPFHKSNIDINKTLCCKFIRYF